MSYTCATSYIIWLDEVFGLHSKLCQPHTQVRAPKSRHGSLFWTIFSAQSLFPTRGPEVFKKKTYKSGPFVSMPFTTASVRNESTTKSIFVVIVHDNVDDTKQRTDTDAWRKKKLIHSCQQLKFLSSIWKYFTIPFFTWKASRITCEWVWVWATWVVIHAVLLSSMMIARCMS